MCKRLCFYWSEVFCDLTSYSSYSFIDSLVQSFIHLITYLFIHPSYLIFIAYLCYNLFICPPQLALQCVLCTVPVWKLLCCYTGILEPCVFTQDFWTTVADKVQASYYSNWRNFHCHVTRNYTMNLLFIKHRPIGLRTHGRARLTNTPFTPTKPVLLNTV